MKRKSGRKSSKKEDDGSNGVDNNSEQNGDGSDYEEDESPKKRKSSKSSRKSVSFSPKKEGAVESEESGDQKKEDQKEDKKSKSSRKSPRKEDTDESQESDNQDNKDEIQEKRKTSKKEKANKKGKLLKKEVREENSESQDECQYEVEAILDEKIIKGVRHYLIRWKGYEEESDTWEPEDTLDCDQLIQEFKEKKPKVGRPKKSTFKKEKKEGEDWDEDEDFEVDRILEVHHKKDGKREFLVSWKGYGPADNSWEPEENMDCKDLIKKFMAKVEKAKLFEERELRVNRQHVQRYTLCTTESGRRLSKRFKGKERVQYHDAE